MTRVLEVAGLRKRFGGIAAVDGVSFDVDEGEILGIIGPNGCGKSTLFNCILGQLAPTEGEVRLDGRVVTGMRPCELNRLGVSRTFQLLQVFPQLSVRENLILAGQEHQGTMLSRLVRPAGRRPRPGAPTDDRLLQARPSRRRAGRRLSYGQQKLLDAAMAFMAGPRLVLLDEPAGGVNPTMLVDPQGAAAGDQSRAAARPSSSSSTTWSSSCRCARASSCMAEGQMLAEGAPEAIRADPAVIEAYLGH